MKKLLPILLCILLLVGALPISVHAAEAEELGEVGADITDDAPASTGATVDEAAPTGFKLRTEAEFQAKLAACRQKYPHGTVWAGYYYEPGYSGYRATTCWAYACQIMYEVFDAQFYNEGLYSKYKSYDSSVLNAGDWVRINGDSHSIFLTKITPEGVYYTDGNGTGVYNQVRWDGFYSNEQIQRIFSYKIHLPGNNLIGGEITHLVNYGANGGEGEMGDTAVAPGQTFTLEQNGFTRDGYSFAGYTVQRSNDKKWYTTDAGWQTQTEIYNNNYHYKVYPQGGTYTLGTPWLADTGASTVFTFHAQWLPDYGSVEFMSNYSGYNYILGSDLQENYSEFIFSRNESTYTVSVDDSVRMNNQSTLKIVGTAAGKSGKDLAFVTATNYGYGDGFSQVSPMGDDREYCLQFIAKSSVDGAKMYVRWGFSNHYESVTLSTDWKVYKISLPKTPFYGSGMHPYFDKAGTFYLNSISLVAGDDNTNVVPETADWACQPMRFQMGQSYGYLPTPEREGYTFEGWYTAADGGEEILPDTIVQASAIKLYAHWKKNVSDIPVKTIEADGHVYELYDNTMGWLDAEAFCEAKGGHLLVINSADENQMAYEMINDRQGYCWIGLNYNTTAQRWQWVNDDPPSYMNWYNSKFGSEDNGKYFAFLYPMNFNTTAYAGKWNKCVGSTARWSYYCYYNSFFICEYDSVDYLGDADRNGIVDPTDATWIQRYNASMRISLDEDTLIRLGDVDCNGELELIDATLIQRYSADMHTPYKIGQRMTT